MGRAWWMLLSAAVAGCAGSGQMLCKPDPITGSQQCQLASQSPGDAALTGGVAAGVYAFTGCTVNGCPLPDTCNPRTKRCEPIRCSETRSCPAGYRCALDVQLCR
jgi:hypothetical protein